MVLLDQNVPKGVKGWCGSIEVRTATEMGWAHFRNGDLIDAAEGDGFRVLVTADKNLGYQQNLAGRTLSIVVLPTNRWTRLRPARWAVMRAITQARLVPRSFIMVGAEPEPSPNPTRSAL